MKAGRLSGFAPTAFAVILILVLISLYEWVDEIIWSDITREQQHLHVSVFITSVSCIAAFFITRYVRTKSMLAAIVESSEDGIIGKDLDGRITSWNSGAKKMFGYSFEEVRGKPDNHATNAGGAW